MGAVRRKLCPAYGTWEHVIAGVYPAQAKLCLKIPMPAENPGMPIGRTKTGKPTLIAAVGKNREVRAGKLDVVADAAYIALAAKGIDRTSVV